MSRKKPESVEDFLKRGGTIQHIPRGVSTFDTQARRKRQNFTLSQKGGANAEGYDPKASGKRANQRLFE